MPEYRATDFDRHGGGRTEFRRDAGVLQPHVLSDLPNPSRMVRQGSLGLRRWKYALLVAARTTSYLTLHLRMRAARLMPRGPHYT
jgi:hypothetical protein